MNQTPSQAARSFSIKKIEQGFQPQALHCYTDAKGHPIYYRIRLKHIDGHKWIRPMYQDEKGEYHLTEPPALKDKLKPLYGLHLLVQHPDAIVFIVEGEYPVDSLNRFFDKHNVKQTYIAITSGSANSASNTDWKSLSGRTCLLWPDYDEAGIFYTKNVYDKLAPLTNSIEIINVKELNLPKGGDCIDWFKLNPSPLITDIVALPRVTQSGIKTLDDNKTIKNDDEVIARLAKLPLLQYDRVRLAEAELLGVRPPTLDDIVKKTRASTQQENQTPFTEIEPWHEPIHPAILLTEIASTIKRFIVCQPEIAHAATLWIAMTWFIDVIQIAPLAVITAPEKRCGKSQLLFLMNRLVYRPLAVSNITSAALFRTVDAWQPTLLIDEADAFIRENEELRGLLNCGHTRESAFTVRVVGDNHVPQTFFVWGAKALAGIGQLADTLMDRAIILELRRKLANEKVDRLRHAEPNLFPTLSAKLARFAQDYADKIQHAKPLLPNELNDRAQDNWEPLLAIADIAGETWPKLARAAALKLSDETQDAKSMSVELLTDIQETFKNKDVDRISSKDLITALCTDEEKPWATYNRGLQIRPNQVARRLKEFGIVSHTVRFSDIDTAKGYTKSQFTDTFTRYLTVSPKSRHNVTSQ